VPIEHAESDVKLSRWASGNATEGHRLAEVIEVPTSSFVDGSALVGLLWRSQVLCDCGGCSSPAVVRGSRSRKHPSPSPPSPREFGSPMSTLHRQTGVTLTNRTSIFVAVPVGLAMGWPRDDSRPPSVRRTPTPRVNLLRRRVAGPDHRKVANAAEAII
jgi:hypothetical protein